MNTTISYQGEPGANSHIIIQEAYPDWTPLPCATFEDAFTAVQDGSAALGMIPIENSIAGRVADIHHLLPAGDGFRIALKKVLLLNNDEELPQLTIFL